MSKKENKIILLDGFLHDSTFYIDEVVYKNNEFKIKLNRIYYERPFEKKLFSVLPVIKYKSISSILTITNIENYELIWTKKLINIIDRNDEKNFVLLDFKINNDSVIIFCDSLMSLPSFEYVIKYTKNSKIFLEDKENTISSLYMQTDFFKKMNSWNLEKIKKIKDIFRNGEFIKNLIK